MDDLSLPPKVLQAMQKITITTSITSVLEMSVSELVKTTKLSEHEVKILQKAVSEKAVRPKFVTAYDLYLNRRKLSFGSPILDQHLCGGIMSEGITEIYGESACGKTQFCLQLCLTVQLPLKLGGLEGGAVYICTEDKFPAKRLEQMKPHFKQQYLEFLGNTNVGDNIYVKHVIDVNGLFDILDNKIPALMTHAKVCLVVIDSIAALFRVEYSMNEMYERAQVLNRIGARLAQLSHRNNMPVVCVNQVTAVFNKSLGERKCKIHDYVKPCLGKTWSDWVTVRMMLLRSTSASQAGNEWAMKEVNEPERELVVIFSRTGDSPLDKVMKACRYTVDASGVHGVLVNDAIDITYCKCSHG